MKQLSVAIVKTKGERTTTKGSKIVDLSVKELSTGKYYDVACFVDSDGFPYNVGDECLMGINQGTFQGKPSYSTGLKSMELITKKTGKDAVPQKIWEDKDKRMVRMNALTHALKTVELSKVDTKELSEYEVASMVEGVAESYMEWVYKNGEEKPEEIE